MTYLDKANQALEVLTSNAVDNDTVKEDKATAQDTLLEAFQEAETEGANFHTVKKALCEDNGYSYKVYDASDDKMLTIEGLEAPQVFKNNMSALKKGYNIDKTLVNFGSFKEMKEASKEVDPITDCRVAAKRIFKAMKALNNVDTQAEYQASLERMADELEKAVKARSKK